MSTEEVVLEPVATEKGLFPMDIYEPAGYVLPRSYRPYYKKVLELPVRDDDVWIVSYPKCGSTWTSEMVWLLRHSHDFNAANQVLEERVPFLEYTTLLLNGLDEEQVEKQKKTLPMLYGDSVGFVTQWPKSDGPRTIKTHLQWDVLPKDLRQPDSKAKIIYVAREAKDVCVSFYHHHKLMRNICDSFEEYAEHFLGDNLMFAPFWRHVLQFWRLRDRENLLFLKYEEMKKDLPSVIRQVNNFLNLAPLSKEQVQKLQDHLSFESMKRNKAVNKANVISQMTESRRMKEMGKNVRNEKGQFIRKGIVGDWRETMSPEMVRRFNEWTDKETAGSGLTF